MKIFHNPSYDFLRYKWPFIGVSILLMVAGVVSLIANGGPRYGIDFRGGTLVYVKFQEQPPIAEIREALRGRGLGETTLQQYGPPDENEVLIGLDVRGEQALDEGRTAILETLRNMFAGEHGDKIDLNNAGRDRIYDRLAAGGLGDQQAAQLADAIFERRAERSGLLRGVQDVRDLPGFSPQAEQIIQSQAVFAPYNVFNVEVVGPKVGGDLRRQALYATLYALTGMLVYIAFRFEWVYGVAAVLAVLHDVIITVGFFSLFDVEISLTVVAALLTLVGYSMNDTIVVFDRMRENLKFNRREKFGALVNRSINQTLNRTVLTSGLTFLTVLALFLFGGEVLRAFSFALVVGILIGTYSSVFIAAPIVEVWQRWSEARGGRVFAVEKDRGRPGARVGVKA